MNEVSLRDSLTRRVHNRAVVQGSIVVPAVPGMLDEYVAMCDRTFSAIGVKFTAEELTQLREVIASQLAVAFEASPRSSIVITYDSPAGLVVNYHVKAQWSSLEEAYDSWLSTREPPLFGTEPDARIWASALNAADPADFPILDLGAGTGRNALPLARRGHPVDAVEVTLGFAATLRQAAQRDSLPVRVIERDIFDSADSLRTDYSLIVMSEVASDFRTIAQLRQTLELAAQCLAPGGHLVMNAFLARDGYEPDASARELGQQAYTSIFTRGEMSDALSGLPLVLESDESVLEYERANLPEGSWPPTSWYERWVSGQDVFDIDRETSPVELRWLVFRRQS